jgi:prepilin peptidase CpaA
MPLVQWGVVIGASLAAAVCDLAVRRIPNWLTAPVLVGGLGWSIYVGGLAGLGDAVVSCIVLALPYVLLFLLAGGGAGDAKLMGAIGTWLGFVNGIVVLCTVSVSAIVLAVGMAVAGRRLRPVLLNLGCILCGALLVILGRGKLRDRQEFMPGTADMQKMPYGIAILAGVCLAAGGVLWWRG